MKYYIDAMVRLFRDAKGEETSIGISCRSPYKFIPPVGITLELPVPPEFLYEGYLVHGIYGTVTSVSVAVGVVSIRVDLEDNGFACEPNIADYLRKAGWYVWYGSDDIDIPWWWHERKMLEQKSNDTLSSLRLFDELVEAE